MTKLYRYQKVGVRRLGKLKLWAILADDMGLGKTIQVLMAIKRYLKKKGPIIVVCPATAKYTWEEQASEHARMNVVLLNGRRPSRPAMQAMLRRDRVIYILSYNCLTAWRDVILHADPALLVFDECFPAGTMVATDQGNLPIEKIVEDKLPVKVASVDSSINGIAFKPIKQYIKIRRRTRLVTVHHEWGSLTCTEEHLIWTVNRGYVKAIELEAGEALRVVSGTNATGQAQVLQHLLLREVEDATTGGTQEGVQQECTEKDSGGSQESLPEPYGPTPQKGGISPHDEKQPGQQPRDDAEDPTNEREERNTASVERQERRQWNCHTATTSLARGARTQMESGTADPHWQGSPVPNELQGRHRPEETQDRSGDRRTDAPLERTETEGPQETEPSRISRVDRVEIHEQRGGQIYEEGGEDHSFVYCLEVDGDPNFFAGGVQVHNCQRLKNPGAKWTRAAMQLKAPHMIFMGGTGGIEKTPLDLWPALHMLRRSNWPPDFRRMTSKENYTQFAETFTILLDTPWGRKPAGVKNMKPLHQFLKKFLLIRRRTKDVLKDLPPVQRFRVPMEMTSRKEYVEAENTARNEMWQASRDFGGKNEVKIKAIAGNLMRKVVKLKLASVTEWIEQFLEESEEKLICFGHHKIVVKGLHKRFGEAISVRVDGSVTGRKRQAAIDRFNNDPSCRLLFGNMKAAGESWSCRSASNIAFMEVFPNPAVHNQCERRVRGVGRGVKGKPSRYFYLIAKETAEERLLAKVRKEQRTIDKAIDGGRTGGGIDLFEVITGGKR